MINFLWINAINSFSEVETRYPNLGIGYLIASLKAAFGDTCFHFKIVNSDIDVALDGFKPQVVGISCVSQNYGLARDYAQKAHERGIPVMVGGVHISFFAAEPDKSHECWLHRRRGGYDRRSDACFSNTQGISSGGVGGYSRHRLLGGR